MIAIVQPQRYTTEEFLEILPALDPTLDYQLENGLIIPMPKTSPEHQSLLSKLLVRLALSAEESGLTWEILPGISFCPNPGECRFPDLTVVDRAFWLQQEDSILREAPSAAIEIVSINWRDDYEKKPLWYAGYGVQELWLIDPLYVKQRYPKAKNPKIAEPTISIGKLKPSPKITVQYEYDFQVFTGSNRIESELFPELKLTVDQIVAFGLP